MATATVAARFGLPCVVYMGEVDTERQKPNVFRMNLLGAEVRPVTSGSRTLKDAMNEALRDWVANVEDTFYIIGSAAGPHPYPAMVRDFQTVIGNETRAQMLAQERKLPDLVVACVGGGSNAIGMFHPFVDDAEVEIHGVEAAGEGVDTPRHAATISKGSPGVLHGARSYLLQDAEGQVQEAHSISAGLDYPGVGPEHSWLKDIGRVKYFSATDQEALDAFQLLSKLEGIIPGAGIRACPGACRPDCAQDAQGSVHRRLPVGPRRQGCVLGRRRAGRKDMSRIAARFAELKAQGTRRLRAFHHRRRSGFRNLARDPGGVAGRGRRCDRTGHALHRSDGGRPGGAGVEPAGAARRAPPWRAPSSWCAAFASATTRPRSC